MRALLEVVRERAGRVEPGAALLDKLTASTIASHKNLKDNSQIEVSKNDADYLAQKYRGICAFL